MSDNRRYIGRWLSGILMLLLLLTGCSKSSENGENDEPQPDKSMLKIYVFSPDQPIVTRADIGDVDASTEEKKVNSLHVWVFEHHEENNPKDGKYVGHISLSNVDLSETTSNTVTMELDETFANMQTKPNVDVYVLANVTAANCGLSLDASTTRDQLDAALIKQNYFGVSNLTTTVPVDGLPMSGVMKNKKITGSKPIYQVAEAGGELANVRLVRAVSKIRFVFSKSTSNNDEVTVNSIKFDRGVMPTQEYLFLNDAYDLTQKWKVWGDGDEPSYELEKDLVSSVDGADIDDCESPASYKWDGVMSGQQYETKIQEGINAGDLTDLGTFYLRESDQKLTGAITYTLKHTEEQKNGTADPTVNSPKFFMKTVGDFSRNHTWIVYAYFVSSGDLVMGIVEIKDWGSSENTSQSVYNW